MSRLQIQSPGPGYIHLPEWVDEEFVAQLTAEKAIRKYAKGRGAVREWVKLRERNEALDLEVCALAALDIMGPGTVAMEPCGRSRRRHRRASGALQARGWAC